MGATPLEGLKLLPGPHRFVVSLAGYGEQRLDLELPPGEFMQRHVELARQRGRITVRSTPAGAEILEGHLALGHTPLVEHELDAGAHTLVLRKPGYVEHSLALDVPANEVLERRVELEPRPATLRVLASVDGRDLAGATVTLDGVVLGVTPVSHTLEQPGRYRLKVEAEGLPADERELVVAPGAREMVHVRFKSPASPTADAGGAASAAPPDAGAVSGQAPDAGAP